MDETQQEIEWLINMNRELIKVAHVNLNVVNVNDDRIQRLKRRLKKNN